MYQIDESNRTGFPANLEITIGSPSKPGQLLAGDTTDQTYEFRLRDIKKLRAWINQLWIGRVRNNGAGVCYGELDLSTNSIPSIEGSFTAQSIAVGEIAIGGHSGRGMGVLRLPASVTNLWCNTFDMGAQIGSSDPGNSIVFFGTNTQPITMTVVSNCYIGHALFQYADPVSVTNNGFPPGSRLWIGQPSLRATLELGCIKQSLSSCQFGKGLGTMAVYATSLTIGRSTSAGSYHYITNDFRAVTQFVWDVQGTISIGPNNNDNTYTFPPASGSVSCLDLQLGSDTVSNKIIRSFLALSNIVITVSNSVTLKETGVVTNFVEGYSSGFDIGATNLDIQDPKNWTGFSDYGRMTLRFLRDPVNPYAAYWGLRMKGNGVSVIQALTNTSPRRLTWSTNGLSASAQARFGIVYDSARNVTYVGVQPIPSGALLLIR